MKKLGRVVESLSELMENLLRVENYLSGEDEEDYNNMIKLIAHGTNFVVYRSGGKLHFAPSRFIGYFNNNLLKHLVKGNGKDGKKTTPAINKIIGYTRSFDRDLEKDYLEFCRELNVKPKQMVDTKRKYWVLNDEQNQKFASEYLEGNVQQVLVNKYERNPVARRKCIKKYGCTCQVCGMNFETIYGELGKGFIHVHHIVPISEKKGKEYKIDPENDLIPVCPNCHAMLHKGNLTVSELIDILKKNE